MFLPRIASVISTARLFSFTSWTRTKAQPFITPMTEVAIVPSTRWANRKIECKTDHGFTGSARSTGNRDAEKAPDDPWFQGSFHMFFQIRHPGSRIIRSSLMPALRAMFTHSCVSVSMSVRKLLYFVLALLCIRQQATSCLAITPAISGSYFSPHTSLTRSAPACTATSATLPLYVSTEIGTSKCLRSASMIGTTRAASSSALTGVCPGRVDSPPTSRISAPSQSLSQHASEHDP